MSMSSNSERRPRAIRKVPRRHNDSADQKAASYDGGEFPVLLRMPDVSMNELPAAELSVTSVEDSEPVEEAVDEAVEQAPVEEVKSSPPRRQSRHSRHSKHRDAEKPPEESPRLTGLSSKQFWLALGPKIAVGGMLLGVMAISGVMLLRPRPDSTTVGMKSSDWSLPADAGTAPKDFTPASSIPIAQETSSDRRDTFEGSIASKPQFDDPPQASPTHVDSHIRTGDMPIPRLQTDPSKSQSMPIAEPNVPYAQPDSPSPTPANEDSRPATDTSDDVYRAQGWPDETNDRDAESENNADVGLGPQLNSAMQSQTRTSFLPKRPVNPPVMDANGGRTRLNGTVEIPNPRTGYR